MWPSKPFMVLAIALKWDRALSDPAPIDYQQIRSQLGGDDDILQKFLESSLQNLPVYMREVKSAVASSDRDLAKKQLHKLIGATRYFQWPDMLDRLQWLHNHIELIQEQRYLNTLEALNKQLNALLLSIQDHQVDNRGINNGSEKLTSN